MKKPYVCEIIGADLYEMSFSTSLSVMCFQKEDQKKCGSLLLTPGRHWDFQLLIPSRGGSENIAKDQNGSKRTAGKKCWDSSREPVSCIPAYTQRPWVKKNCFRFVIHISKGCYLWFAIIPSVNIDWVPYMSDARDTSVYLKQVKILALMECTLGVGGNW